MCFWSENRSLIRSQEVRKISYRMTLMRQSACKYCDGRSGCMFSRSDNTDKHTPTLSVVLVCTSLCLCSCRVNLSACVLLSSCVPPCCCRVYLSDCALLLSCVLPYDCVVVVCSSLTVRRCCCCCVYFFLTVVLCVPLSDCVVVVCTSLWLLLLSLSFVPVQVINVDDDGNELGSGVMELTDAELVLHTHRRDDVRWPYLCLRRYGYDSNLFSFESGRRCQTGQGTCCLWWHLQNMQTTQSDSTLMLHWSYIHTSVCSTSERFMFPLSKVVNGNSRTCQFCPIFSVTFLSKLSEKNTQSAQCLSVLLLL